MRCGGPQSLFSQNGANKLISYFLKYKSRANHTHFLVPNTKRIYIHKQLAGQHNQNNIAPYTLIHG